MTSLVFVTQMLDERDPVLGFVPRLVRALSSRVDALTVVANEVHAPLPELPANVDVVSLGKERGAGRVRRGLRYERALLRLTARRPPDALLAHMCPSYLTLAAPIAIVRRVPKLLWFAHPSTTWSLRLANAFADAVLTSLPGAYPLRSRKVHVIGQATNTEELAACPPRRRDGPLRILALGRTSPSKGFDTIMRAVAECRDRGLEVEARIVGPSVTSQEVRHRSYLESLVRELRLEDRVMIAAGVSPEAVPAEICWSDLLVNAMVAGSGDKVVFEAAAIGRPVLVSNPAFRDLLARSNVDLMFREGDPVDLAGRLAEVDAMDERDLASVAGELRRRVREEHSADHWANSVIEVARRMGRTAVRR